MDESTVLLCRINFNDLIECINILQETPTKKFSKTLNGLQVQNVSSKVVRIQSYISFINRNTWKIMKTKKS